MMRIGWIVLLLAVIAAALVGLRARQNSARAETYRLEAQRIAVRRRLWDQQIQLSGGILEPSAGERPLPPAIRLVGPGESVADHRIARRD